MSGSPINRSCNSSLAGNEIRFSLTQDKVLESEKDAFAGARALFTGLKKKKIGSTSVTNSIENSSVNNSNVSSELKPVSLTGPNPIELPDELVNQIRNLSNNKASAKSGINVKETFENNSDGDDGDDYKQNNSPSTFGKKTTYSSSSSSSSGKNSKASGRSKMQELKAAALVKRFLPGVNGKYIEDSELADEQLQFVKGIEAGLNVCGTGPGGCGKSFAVKAACQRLVKAGKKFAITASTGIAAVEIGGSTYHSLMGLGLAREPIPVLIKKITMNKEVCELIQSLDTIFVDEMSMSQPRWIDIWDLCFRAVRGQPDEAFGGLQMIFTGDYLQLTPVLTDEDKKLVEKYAEKYGEVESANANYEFLFQHPKWNQYIQLTVLFKRKYRQTNPEFGQFLDHVRIGKLSLEDEKFCQDRLRAALQLGCDRNKMSKGGIKPSMIHYTNKAVDEDNMKELYRVEPDMNKHIFYTALDIRVQENAKTAKVFDQHMKFMRENFAAHGVIELAKGSQVMLVYNKNVEGGLANGSKGIIVGWSEKMTTEEWTVPTEFPIVKFENKLVDTILPHPFVKVDLATGHSCKYVQVPLRLCDALTAHKNQGLTLSSALINQAPMTQFGMTYTAFSRVKEPSGIWLSSWSRNSVRAHAAAVKYYEDLEVTQVQYVLPSQLTIN